MGRSFEDDPLSRAMAPPQDETPEERMQREREELAARQISDKIDEQIRTEKVCLRPIILPRADIAPCRRLLSRNRRSLSRSCSSARASRARARR
jgi:hypothetical protein